MITLPRLNVMHGFKLDLLSCELPNGVYPVNEYYNGISVLEDTGAATLTTTIASSSYTGSTLATAVAAALSTESTANGNGTTYTGTYDSATKKITIAGDDDFAWRAVANDMYEQLGVTTLTAAVAASVTGDVPINVSGSAYVDLLSNFSTNNWSSSTSSKIFGRIPLTGDFGEVIVSNFPEQEAIYISSPEFSTLTLYLRDDRGNPWKMPSTMHLSLTIRLEPLENDSAVPGSANRHDISQGFGSIGSGSAITLSH